MRSIIGQPLRSIVHRPQQCISVYEGISPALLATMSLSQGIRGSSQAQLIGSLARNNIIHSAPLRQALLHLDRRLFVANPRPDVNYYQNKPHRISGGQNMTDIFTQAVVLEGLAGHLQQQQAKGGPVRVLDVGTGHGYMCYAIAGLLHQLRQGKEGQDVEIVGIDVMAKAVEFAYNLKRNPALRISQDILARVHFHEETLELRLKQPQVYNIIVGGFYMPPYLHQSLCQKLIHYHSSTSQPAVGIWPTDSSSGQSLFKFETKAQGSSNISIAQHEIMSTMFSMPVVRSTVAKYFVEEGEGEEESPPVNEEEVRKELGKLKRERRDQEKEQTKEKLKEAIARHSAQLNKKLTLQQMRRISEISQLLARLNRK